MGSIYLLAERPRTSYHARPFYSSDYVRVATLHNSCTELAPRAIFRPLYERCDAFSLAWNLDLV